MTTVILDASAVLAFALDEPGGGIAKDAIDRGALVSAVNHCEVVSKLIDTIPDETALADAIGFLTYDVMEFGADLAVEAARLRPATRSKGLSLADRACLALALREGLPVITTDRQWLGTGLQIDIQLAR